MAKLSNFTRSQIKILLTNDNVKKDGDIFKNASFRVKVGEEYEINISISTPEKIEAEKIPLDIIYEDDDIIVINKLAGMVTHPAPGNTSGTLVNALIHHIQ